MAEAMEQAMWIEKSEADVRVLGCIKGYQARMPGAELGGERKWVKGKYMGTLQTIQ